MSRTDVLLVLSGFGAAIVLLMLLGFVRALILRRRRKRLASQAWRTSLRPDDAAIEAVRREADEGHKRYLRRQEEEEQRRLEPDWRRDGEIFLTSRKPPEEAP